MGFERVWFGQVSLGWISTLLGAATLLLGSSQVALALHGPMSLGTSPALLYNQLNYQGIHEVKMGRLLGWFVFF